VFEVTSLCLYICTRPCLPLVDGFADDTLSNTVPNVNASTHHCHIFLAHSVLSSRYLKISATSVSCQSQLEGGALEMILSLISS